MRAGPIRCWCEWIFDAIFAFLFLNLYSVLLMIRYIVNTYGVTEDLRFNSIASVCTPALCIGLQKCHNSHRLQFLCIFTNLEVAERYLPIIRGAGTPFHCVQGTSTTAYKVGWLVGVEFNVMPHSTQYRSFRRRCVRNCNVENWLYAASILSLIWTITGYSTFIAVFV